MNEYLEGKLLQFDSALKTLQRALIADPSELEVDGAIQRFEYCFELAWKVLKIRLESDGIRDVSSPRNVLQRGFVAGILEDEESWITMLNDRNLSVHTYNEQTAREIYSRFPQHLAAMQKLLSALPG
jgi:nucleotidyltransferase substrate binding protein (TIGR01987 family)